MSEKGHTAANSTITLPPPLSPTFAKSHDDAHWREAYKFNQCDYTYAQAHKLQKHKMTHTGEKAHITSLPYTRTKIKYTNIHRVEVLQIQPVRLHLHSSR